jgi:hypothetical protein
MQFKERQKRTQIENTKQALNNKTQTKKEIKREELVK